VRKKIEVEKIHEYTGHKGSLFALEVDHQEKFAYSSGDDGIVVQWNLGKKDDQGMGIIRIGCAVYSLLKIPGRELLVIGSSDGTVYFVDLKSKQIIHTYRKTTDAVYDLYFDEKLDQVWILQASGFLGIVSLNDFKILLHDRIVPNHLRVVQSSQTGEKKYLGTSDNYIVVLSEDGEKLLDHWKAHENSVFSLCLNHDGKYLISGARDAHLNIWDLQQPYQLIKSIPAHNFTINAIVLSPYEDILVTGSRDKTLKVWDAYSFDLLKVIDHKRNEAHVHSVNRLRWIKFDNSLISCSDDRRLIRWHIHTTA